MILYDFVCTSCDEVFEEFARVSDKTCKCKHCGAEAKRLISAPRIKLGLDFPGRYHEYKSELTKRQARTMEGKSADTGKPLEE